MLEIIKDDFISLILRVIECSSSFLKFYVQGRKTMKNDIFPPIYNQKVFREQQEKIQDARNQSYKNERMIENTRIQGSLTSDRKDTGFSIGMSAGFFLCICATINGSLATGCMTWFFVVIVATVIGMAMDKAAKEQYEGSVSQKSRRLWEEKNGLENTIKKIEENAQIEMEQYYQEFENQAQQLSVQYASSQVAQEVIGWMTDGFYQTIDAANRKSYMEVIEVPFMFQVFEDKISCNLGIYDFEEKRCQSLDSNLKQAALSRAIASAIQVNIVMKYPEDVSGTKVRINLSYEYSDVACKATITYVAPNGNYKPVREW